MVVNSTTASFASGKESYENPSCEKEAAFGRIEAVKRKVGSSDCSTSNDCCVSDS